MSNITYSVLITDLFNNTRNVNNDALFLLIHSDNIKQLLEELDTDGSSSIYGYNVKSIASLFNNYNLDLNNFRFLYHIYYSIDIGFPSTIVVANKSITTLPIDYKLIDKYNVGTIWSAAPYNGYYPLGCVYTKNIKPTSNNFNFGIIDANYLIRTDNLIDKITSINEFHSITHPTVEKFTILRGRAFAGHTGFKVLSNEGKYITHSINGEDILTLRTKEYKNQQQVSYNPQGELVMDNKCLTANDDLSVSLKNCSPTDQFYRDYNTKQKWYPTKNKIVSQYNDKCLTAESDDTLKLNDCNGAENQNWSYEQTAQTDPRDYSWKNYKGKMVVLVHSEDPWYVNTDITEQVQYDKSDPELNKVVYKNADYKANFKYDLSREDLGYGHSFASRKGEKCSFDSMGNRIEGFNGDDSQYIKIINLIASIMLIILIVYMIYKRQ